MHLDVPVLIQVIDAGDAAPIAMWIVNMSHLPQPVTWVTHHHGLGAPIDDVAAQPPSTVADYSIHVGHESTDASVAWLMAFHPGDLLPTDAAWQDSPLARHAGACPASGPPPLPALGHPVPPPGSCPWRRCHRTACRAQYSPGPGAQAQRAAPPPSARRWPHRCRCCSLPLRLRLLLLLPGPGPLAGGGGIPTILCPFPFGGLGPGALGCQSLAPLGDHRRSTVTLQRPQLAAVLPAEALPQGAGCGGSSCGSGVPLPAEASPGAPGRW